MKKGTIIVTLAIFFFVDHLSNYKGIGILYYQYFPTRGKFYGGLVVIVVCFSKKR